MVKHLPSVMLLGAMSSNGIAGLFFLSTKTTMNSIRYHKMLENELKIRMAIHECIMFMQGGAPCHCSKLMSDFLKKNIKILDWPGDSPNLNPIENLWAIMIEKVADKHPTTAKNLEMAIKHIWIHKITCMPCYLQLLSRTKVNIPNIRFLQENCLM